MTRLAVSAAVAGRPRTLNAERRGTVWQHRRDTADEREAWGWAWRQAMTAAGVDQFDRPVHVHAWPFLAHPLQDTGNAYPSVKAAVDGARDVGLLVDDDPERVVAVTLYAPRRVARPDQSLTVTLEAVT